MKNTHRYLIIILLVLLFIPSSLDLFAAAPEGEPGHGSSFDILVIRNVVIIDGKGTPPRGPVDVIIKKNTIDSIRRASKDKDRYKEADKVIDGTGMYLLPGFINLHAHIHDNRGGNPIPFEYLYKLWLSCGITAVRDVGSNYKLTVKEREKSRKNEIAA
ncbi:MAG: amidohydrolase, partial [bacterium]|nr:amidohydrolase [bacterium]